MVKQKWYKNKGGWIGAGLGAFVWFYQHWRGGCKTGNLFSGFSQGNCITSLFGIDIMIFWVPTAIIGFLIGSFIYNKFIRKKR